MAYDYAANGVRIRVDGLGDQWANYHRSFLGSSYHMLDFDGWRVCDPSLERTENTEDHLFCEVVMDHQRGEMIRDVHYLAIFDRKSTLKAVHQASFTRAVYLNMCRRFSLHQPFECRFIYVIGGQQPPWQLIQCDIRTGTFGMPLTLDASRQSWLAIWAATGLAGARRNSERLLRSYE